MPLIYLHLRPVQYFKYRDYGGKKRPPGSGRDMGGIFQSGLNSATRGKEFFLILGATFVYAWLPLEFVRLLLHLHRNDAEETPRGFRGVGQ